MNCRSYIWEQVHRITKSENGDVGNCVGDMVGKRGAYFIRGNYYKEQLWGWEISKGRRDLL